MSAVSVDMFDLHASIEAAQVKRLQNLERENIRLRKAVSELTLDKLILQEVRAQLMSPSIAPVPRPRHVAQR